MGNINTFKTLYDKIILQVKTTEKPESGIVTLPQWNSGAKGHSWDTLEEVQMFQDCSKAVKGLRFVFANAAVCTLRRPLDYYTMELSEHAEGLSDL